MSKKNIIIIILSLLLAISIGVIIYLVVNSKETSIEEVTGKVIATDSKYVIITTDTEDYIVSNIKGTYDLGDIVKFSYENDSVKDISPKPIKAVDEELITKYNLEDNNTETKEDTNIDNTVEPSENNKPNNEDNKTEQEANPNHELPNTNPKPNTEVVKPNNNPQNNTPSTEQNNTNPDTQSNADTVVMNYVNDYKKEFDSGNITDSLKTGFVTVIDFIFYKGTIKGYYFNDLTEAVKLKVLSIALYFDAKIEKYFPGYKETISNAANKVYTTVKAKIIEAYLNITTKVCTNNPDLCLTAKEDFQSLKTNFGLTWDLLKDIAGDGLTNLKNWYEIWRES